MDKKWKKRIVNHKYTERKNIAIVFVDERVSEPQ